MEAKARSLNAVLEEVSKLDIEDQQYIQEIISRRLADRRRSEIAQRAQEAKEHATTGKARRGTAHDLLADLNG